MAAIDFTHRALLAAAPFMLRCLKSVERPRDGGEHQAGVSRLPG
jgi:hypothetical protein